MDKTGLKTLNTDLVDYSFKYLGIYYKLVPMGFSAYHMIQILHSKLYLGDEVRIICMFIYILNKYCIFKKRV